MEMKKLCNYFLNDRYRYQAYLFLNRPRHFFGIFYQVFIAFLVVFCIIIAPIFPDVWLFWIDLFMIIIFSLEFLIQVWSSTCLPRYRGKRGFIRIILDPICLLDIFIITTTVIGLITNHNEISIISTVLRGLRILQFFEHRYRLWKLIGAVIWNGRFQLLLCVYFALILLVSISFSLHLIEKSNEGFKSLGQSIWFTLITLTTVGYGDAVPITTTGKIVTAMALILGASVFSLPAGIIGAGLALKVEKEETIRSNLQETHAASVIQNAWCVYWTRQMFDFQHHKRHRTSSSPSSIILVNGNHKPKRIFRNLLAMQFIHLLRFSLSCRRFKRSLNMLSTKNFHELYSQNCMEQMEKLANLEMIVRDNEITLNKILSLIKQQKEQSVDEIFKKKTIPITLMNKKNRKIFKYNQHLRFKHNKSNNDNIELNEVD